MSFEIHILKWSNQALRWFPELEMGYRAFQLHISDSDLVLVLSDQSYHLMALWHMWNEMMVPVFSKQIFTSQNPMSQLAPSSYSYCQCQQRPQPECVIMKALLHGCNVISAQDWGLSGELWVMHFISMIKVSWSPCLLTRLLSIIPHPFFIPLHLSIKLVHWRWRCGVETSYVQCVGLCLLLPVAFWAYVCPLFML